MEIKQTPRNGEEVFLISEIHAVEEIIHERPSAESA